MSYKFDMDEFDKKLLEKLSPKKPSTPLTSVFEKIKGMARRKRLPTLRS